MSGYIGSKTSVTVTSPETDSRYVNVTGDTMTGSLTVPSMTSASAITASGGVYLGGTGAANKLDDYETGTWTPVINGSPTVSYSTAPSGDYTKVGRLVFLRFDMTISSISGGSGSFEITGLPFLSSGFPGWSNGIIRNCDGIGVNAQTSHVGFWPNSTSAKLSFEVMSSSSDFGASLINISALKAGRITGVITYRTA